MRLKKQGKINIFDKRTPEADTNFGGPAFYIPERKKPLSLYSAVAGPFILSSCCWALACP